MAAERIEVQRDVAAPPAAVFALLCDPAGQVAIDSSGMLQSADGGRVRPGGRHVRRAHGPSGAERRRDRQWQAAGPLRRDGHHHPVRAGRRAGVDDLRDRHSPPIRHLYGYRLEPSRTGTLVTSYYDWSQIAEQYRGKIGFPVIPEAALRATLGILARTVEK